MGIVRILVEVVDPVSVEGGGTSDKAVHLIALAEQKLGEVAAVLACDPRDKGTTRPIHRARRYRLCGWSSRSVSLAPPPAARSAVALPPWVSATWRTIARPSPEPGSSRAAAAR